MITTSRLVVRPPQESDRARFVELFTDADFMVHSGVLTPDQAGDRFDHMLMVCSRVSFGKQPMVERSSGTVVGYTGVDHLTIEGKTWLEWGYRLIRSARGRGYATEAGLALLSSARRTYDGELLAVIAPGNLASQNVIRKLGFTYWKQADIEGELRNLYHLPAAITGSAPA